MKNKCLLLSTFSTFQTPLTTLTNSALLERVVCFSSSDGQTMATCHSMLLQVLCANLVQKDNFRGRYCDVNTKCI